MFGNENVVNESFDSERYDRLVAGGPVAPPESERSVFPEGLFAMDPDPELAAFLSVVDPNELSGHDQVLVLRAHQKLISHFQAKFYSDVAALADVMFEIDGDWELAAHATAMELRAALRLTRRMAEIEITFAQDLAERLPVVASALGSGGIDLRRAKVLVDGTIHLTGSSARGVVDRVIDRASELTTGELRAKVARLCLTVEPDNAKQRYETAIEQRRVVSELTVDGTANLQLADIAPDRAAQAMVRLNRLARSLKVDGETRTLDQIRADIAIDLLCGKNNHLAATAGTVTVDVNLETLARLSEEPGELAGYGPVVADIARQVAETSDKAEWRYRVTDPETGLPVRTGTTRARRHNTEQRRQIELRDRVCVFPGCRMPATDCDIDHTKTWADTRRTNTHDSAPVCRHDHTGRHSFGWTYQRIDGGDYLWTSRLGHSYTKSGRSPPPK